MSVYHGTRRKLVLAFDVGTAFSGISYSVLDPGQVPEIKGVTRFPAHEHISGASKIPTVIYYDQSGKVRAVGAEAMKEGIYEVAEDENWIKTEWFKLHLRSKVGDGPSIEDLHPLPLNKTVVQVLADFLGYLLKLKSDIDFVLSHPNGWEGAQQSEMRRAAVLAKLVPDKPEGHSRLSFVTEGEASLHYSIQNGLPAGAMKNGDGVVIVDAGGGTIDISSYNRDPNSEKKSFEEIAAPQCHFHGSIFVNNRARQFLENYLTNSPYIDDLEHIVRCFDKTTKIWFMNDTEASQYIKFGSTRDNDKSYNIRFGQLKLTGDDVAKFFQPSIDCVVKAVLEQMENSHKTIVHVVLVGGFAASDWLFTQVHQALSPLGLNVVRPENHVNKAVSDGAISFYLDHFVRTRVSKVTYGTFCDTLYDPNNPDHRSRTDKVFTDVSGVKRIEGFFDIILPKNTQVSETKEFKRSYDFDSDEFPSGSFSKSMAVWCYRGNVETPNWRDIDTNNYTELCIINADLSQVPVLSRPKAIGKGFYYRRSFDIALLFGMTELKVQTAWEESGIEKRSAAQIVYDPHTVANDDGSG